jgi:hypothetical protein
MNSRERRRIRRAPKRAEWVKSYKERGSQAELVSGGNDGKNRNKEKTRHFKSKVHRAAAALQRFYKKYRPTDTAGPQIHDTSMTPSIPRLKRSSGLMTKGRREIQKQLATGRISIDSNVKTLLTRRQG